MMSRCPPEAKLLPYKYYGAGGNGRSMAFKEGDLTLPPSFPGGGSPNPG